MTTSAIHHRPATVVVVAATGFVGALLALTLSSAQASPQHDEHPSVAVHGARAGDADGHDLERACFITPTAWNTSLDGPLPRCHTYLP